MSEVMNEAMSDATRDATLKIVIDNTYSMGREVELLKKILLEIIDICRLINCFDKIEIILYADYDSSNYPIETSGELEPLDNKLKIFSNNMKCIGGGGREASKTGILKALENINNNKIYIIHIGDQKSHDMDCNELQSKYEKQKLGNYFYWNNIINKCISNNVNFTSLMIRNSSYYPFSLLSKLTGGIYKNTDNIKRSMIEIINMWCGVMINPLNTSVPEKLVDILPMEKNIKQTEIIRLNLKEINNIEECLENKMKISFNKIGKDKEYTDIIFKIIIEIINNNVMNLTSNGVFGKIFRKLVSLRRDERRDILINNINIAKNKLGIYDKKIMENWINNSYNMEEEIKEKIQELINKNIITKTVNYVSDNKIFFKNPKETINMFKTLTKNEQSTLKEYLSRLVIVNKEINYIEDLEKTEIPFDMKNSSMFFSLLLNPFVPGTMITSKRTQGIMALLSLNTVIHEQAISFLNHFKGRWINFEIKEDGTPLIPEDFSFNFVSLILKFPAFLKENEIYNAKKILRINNVSRVFNLSVDTKIIDYSTANYKGWCHQEKCKKCEKKVPISLIDKNGACGYCLTGYKTIEQYESNTSLYCCYGCKSFYSADPTSYVTGKRRCHYCRNNQRPNLQQCLKCHNKFVSNKNIDICKGCEKGEKPRKFDIITKTTKVSKLFKNNLDHLLNLAGLRGGYNIKDYKISSEEKYPEMNDKFTLILNRMDKSSKLDLKANNSKLEAYKLLYLSEEIEIPENLEFIDINGNLIINKEEIINIIKDCIYNSKIYKKMCSLCCEEITISNLLPSCGRKNCNNSVCYDCGDRWYSENEIGKIVNPRHCFCMFCSRKPTIKTSSRWMKTNLNSKIKDIVIDNSFYYAWCITCHSVKEFCEKSCANNQVPCINNFECNECKDKNKLSLTEHNIKQCPGCEFPTTLSQGCNHITCPIQDCGAHWCFECGYQFEEENIYEHMNKDHGRIFAYDEPWFDNYDSDTD